MILIWTSERNGSSVEELPKRQFYNLHRTFTRFYDSTSVMMECAGLVLFALFPFTEKLKGCA